MAKKSKTYGDKWIDELKNKTPEERGKIVEMEIEKKGGVTLELIVSIMSNKHAS